MLELLSVNYNFNFIYMLSVCFFIRNYIQIGLEDDICFPYEGMAGITVLQLHAILCSALDSGTC